MCVTLSAVLPPCPLTRIPSAQLLMFMDVKGLVFHASSQTNDCSEYSTGIYENA